MNLRSTHRVVVTAVVLYSSWTFSPRTQRKSKINLSKNYVAAKRGPNMRIPWSVVLFASFLPSVSASYGQTYVFGRTSVPVGPDSFSVATGDFNGDGIVDLVSANQGNNTVSVVLGNAVGGFNAAASYATGPSPSAIITGDFNNDGILDLAVTDANCSVQGNNPSIVCEAGSVSILLGNGDGTFQPHVDFPTGKASFGIAAGDFNGDGKLDLAIVNDDSTVSVLIGQGDGTFQPQVVYNSPDGAAGLAIGDFNNDHKLDLVVAGAHGPSALLGNGDGTFQSPLTQTALTQAPITSVAGQTSQSSSGLAVADFNLDGKLDLYENGSLFLGNGDGTFVLHAIYRTAASAVAVDLNGDGKPDLVLGLGDEVAILLGNGDGSFQTEVDYAAFASDVSVTDVNGDGRLDLVGGEVASGCTPPMCFTSSTGPGSISILLGVGDGTFVGETNYPLQGEYPAGQVVSADFNGDGEPDFAAQIAFSPTNLDLGVFLGNGNGTFQAQISTPLLQNMTSMAAADLNADGKADVAVAYTNCAEGTSTCLPGDVAVLISNGDGTFQPAVSYAAGLQPEYLTIGDFNGDTKPDLAVSNSLSNTISILLNNGNGTFKTHVDYPTGLQPDNIVSGDFNGDGKLDLVVLMQTGISVHLGNGDGTFQPHVDYPVFSQSSEAPVSIAAGDFNQDGKLDLALTTQAGPALILLGNGDGTFQTPIPAGIGGYISVGDFNGDGKPDLLTSAQYGTGFSTIQLGHGDGTFGLSIPAFLGAGTAAVVDLNHDGIPDLIAETVSNTSTTEVAVLLSTPFKAVAPASLHFGSQGIGTVSAPQTITISNPASVTFNITNIVASGNFSQTNDCGTSLAAGAHCTLTVSFSPAGIGSNSGSITVSDNTATGPVAIPLSGTGVNGPALTANPTRLIFSSQSVGTSSKPLPVMLVNSGNSGLNLTGISVAGQDSSDFTQTNNCGASLAAGGGCTINVTFSPAKGGSRIASIAVSGTEPGSPQTIALSGAGVAPPDFTVGLASGSKSSQTIAPGQNAQFSIAVAPAGTFSGTVNLSCNIAPSVTPAPACSLSNASVQLSGTAATVTATITTAAPSTSQSSLSFGGASVAWAAIFLGILLPRKRKRWASLLGITVIAFAAVSLIGCGGSSSPHTTTTSGTPAGTYTATITAVSGSLSHSTTMSVVVQ